jgi:hypothetical protein
MAKRDASGEGTFAGKSKTPRRAGLRTDERDPDDPRRGPPGSATGGIHAVGEAGGGLAAGGLAGTNAPDGEPDFDALENATGSGIHDRLPEDENEPLAGPSGGAVGGTPAGKRAEGGRTGRGISGHETGADGTIGIDPSRKG